MSKIKIIQKIKKMMIHERSARLIGSEKEADNFKLRIEALRQKHNITQEIIIDELPEFDPRDGFYGEPLFDMSSPLFRNKRIIWEEVVFGSVAEYFKCRTLILKSTNLKIVIGEPADRKKVIDSFHFLYAFANKQAGEYNQRFKDAKAKLKPHDYRLNRESFLHGFSFGLSQRLARFRDAEKHLKALKEVSGESDSPAEGETTALVKTEKIVLSEQRENIEKNLKDIKTAPGPKINVIDEDAFISGINTASECALSEEIALSASKTAEDLRNVQEKMQREHEERLQRTYSFINSRFRFGSSDSTITNNRVSQRRFVFDENDEIS